MAARATLVVAGRVDAAIEKEKIEKILLIGLVNSLGEDAPALDAQFGHVASAFPTPSSNGEFGLCISNAGTTSAVTNHLIRVQFNPTAEQFRAALREAFAYALNTGRTSESEPSVDGRVHVIYTGQVMAHTGDWLLSDSAVTGHQIHSWIDSQAAMSWWPQLDKYPNIGDKLQMHLVIPIAGPGTSWAVEKAGHSQSILTHVDVRLVHLSLNIEASWRFGGKPVVNNPANTESYDGIRGFVQQVIHHHPPTVLTMDSDEPALGCALSAQRPALYVFPGAGLATQGCGLFSLQGFSMLLGGAYTAQSPPNWWPMVRNLPRLDAILLPDWSAANLLSYQFITKLMENGIEGSRIIGELLLPPSTVNTEPTSEVALAPPTGIHLGLNHSAWAPQTVASESLPPSMVLYTKLGWGELRLQPLAQRAGLVLLWKTMSLHANQTPPLRIVLPASQLSGSSPVQGLIRLLKSLNNVPQLELKMSNTVASTATKSLAKAAGTASRMSNNNATTLNGSAHLKQQATAPKPQAAPRPATAKPATTLATKKPPVSSLAPPKRPITASAAHTSATAPKRPVDSTLTPKQSAAHPSKPAVPARSITANKPSSGRPATKPSPSKPKALSTADRLAAHSNLVASKQQSAKTTTAAVKSKTSAAPPTKKPAAPLTSKLETKAKSPIPEVSEPSPPAPTIAEKHVTVSSVDETVMDDALRESLELAPVDPLMSGWCSLEHTDTVAGKAAHSLQQQHEQQQKQQTIPAGPQEVSAEADVSHPYDLYKVHKFEGFNESDETDLIEGARTPSSIDQEPDDVVHDHTLEPEESAVPDHEYQEIFHKGSDTQSASPVELSEPKASEHESQVELLDQTPLSGVSERFDLVDHGDNDAAPPSVSPVGGDSGEHDNLVQMPDDDAQKSSEFPISFSCMPAYLGHKAEEEGNIVPEPEMEEFKSQKAFSPILDSPGNPMLVHTNVPDNSGVDHEDEEVIHASSDHQRSEAASLAFHDTQLQETNDLSDTGSFEHHEQAITQETKDFEPSPQLFSHVNDQLSMVSPPAQYPPTEQQQFDNLDTEHANDWVQHTSELGSSGDATYLPTELTPSSEEIDSNVVHENVAFVADELSSQTTMADINQEKFKPTNKTNLPTDQTQVVHSLLDQDFQQEPAKLDSMTEQEEKDDHKVHSNRDQWYHSTGLLEDTTEDEPSVHDEEQREIPPKLHSDLVFSETAHSAFEPDFPADDLLVHASSGLPVGHAPQTVIDTQGQESDHWGDLTTKEVDHGTQMSPELDEHDVAAEHATTDIHINPSNSESEEKPEGFEETMKPEYQAYSHTTPGPMGDVLVAEHKTFAVPNESFNESEPKHFVKDGNHLEYEPHSESTDIESHEAVESQEQPEAAIDPHSDHVVHTGQTDASSDIEADGVSTTVHQPWSYVSGRSVMEDDQSIEAQMRLKMQQDAAQWSAGTDSYQFPKTQEHRQQYEQSSDVSDAEINDTEIVVAHNRTVMQSFQPTVESPHSPPSGSLADFTPMSETATEVHSAEHVESSRVGESLPSEESVCDPVASSDLDRQAKLITGSVDSLEEAVDSPCNVHETTSSELLADSTTVLNASATPTSNFDHEQHHVQYPVDDEEMTLYRLDQNDTQVLADSTTMESSPSMSIQHNQSTGVATASHAPIGFDQFIMGDDQEDGKLVEQLVNVGSPDSQASMDSVVHQQLKEHHGIDQAVALSHDEELPTEACDPNQEIDSHDTNITSTQPALDEAHGEAEALECEHTLDATSGLELHGEVGFRGFEHQTSANGMDCGSIPPLPSRVGSEDHNPTNGLYATSHLPGSPDSRQYANGNAHAEHQHEQQHEIDNEMLSPADRLKMLQTGFTTDFETGHPESTWSPSGGPWFHKATVGSDQLSPDSFGDDDGAHQEAPYPMHGTDFLNHTTSTNPFETVGSTGDFGHLADSIARQTSHPNQSPLISPQADGFDPSQGWGQPQGLPIPVLPVATSRGARTTNIPSRSAPLSRPATASAAVPHEKPRVSASASAGRRVTSTLNSKPATPATLPPGSPVYMDLIWVPGYLTQVPQSMAVEFFTRVRAHTYVLSGDALHPMIGEALIEAKAKWGPNDVELLCKHAGADTQNNTICILPTDEPYEWNCWLRTPCGRISRETGEARLGACGFKVLPSASCCDIEFSAGAVNVRCEGVRIEF